MGRLLLAKLMASPCIYKKNLKTERDSESTLVTEAFDDFFMIYLHKTLNKSWKVIQFLEIHYF